MNKNVSENMRDLARNSPIHQELAAAIENMTPDNDKFALLLTHKYTKTNIAPSGSRALEGVDHDRFLALVEANNFVSVEKKLQFRIAQLDHEVNFFFRPWEYSWSLRCRISRGEGSWALWTERILALATKSS